MFRSSMAASTSKYAKRTETLVKANKFHGYDFPITLRLESQSMRACHSNVVSGGKTLLIMFSFIKGEPAYS